MSDRPVGPGRVGRALVLAAVLALLVAGVPSVAGTQPPPAASPQPSVAPSQSAIAPSQSSVAAGQVDAVSFDATGDRLLVLVARSALGDDPAITIVVAGEERGPFAPVGENSETYSFAVPFEDLAVEGESMANVLVAARADGRLLARDLLTLQYVALDDPAGARFAADGTLHLPVERAVGFDGDLTLAVGDDGTATATLVENGTAAAIDREALRAHAAPLRAGTVEFAVRPDAVETAGDGTITVDVRALATRETSVRPATDGAGLVVESPLVFAGRTYRVEAVAGDGERFVATLAAESDGRLAFGDGSLAGADSATVTLRERGAVVLTTGERELARPGGATTGGDPDADGTDPGADADDGTGTAPGADGDDTGLVPAVEDRYVAAAAVLAVIVGLLGAVGAVLLRARRRAGRGRVGRGGAGQSGTSRSGTSRSGTGRGPAGPASAPEVAVRVVDGATDEPVDVDGEVLAEPTDAGDADRRTAPLVDGRASIRLEPGGWRLTARGDGVTVADDVRVSGATTVALRVPPDRVAVEVRDAETDEPVADAAVVYRPADGEERTERTDGSGRVEFEAGPDAGPAAVTVRHDRYEEATERTGGGTGRTGDATARTADGGPGGIGTLHLRPLTGGVRAAVTVDGRPTAGVPVEVVARDAYVKRHRPERHEAATDDRGRVDFEDLLAGTYEVRMAFPEGRRRFSRPSRMVEVTDGSAARANLDVTFSYSLTPGQLNRMAAVRGRVESLFSPADRGELLSSPADREESPAEATERDVVLPRYYGSVVSALLDAVERLPAEGHRFAGADAPADRLVDAVLDAAEAAIDAVETAMASPRNDDLFVACADLPDREVAWDGEFEVATLFDRLAADRDEQGRSLQKRLAAVEERIADERAGLATLSPVEDPLAEVEALVEAARRDDDPVALAATAFAAEGVLDAIEGVLEDEGLRERLTRSAD